MFFEFHKFLDNEEVDIAIQDFLHEIRLYCNNSNYSDIELAKIEIANAMLQALKLPTEPVIQERIKAFTEYRKSSIPASLRWSVFERDDFRCRHCSSRSDLAADHIHPESQGGETTLENLQTLCRKCNSKKGARCQEDS